jgi:hypothetical protein
MADVRAPLCSPAGRSPSSRRAPTPKSSPGVGPPSGHRLHSTHRLRIPHRAPIGAALGLCRICATWRGGNDSRPTPPSKAPSTQCVLSHCRRRRVCAEEPLRPGSSQSRLTFKIWKVRFQIPALLSGFGMVYIRGRRAAQLPQRLRDLNHSIQRGDLMPAFSYSIDAGVATFVFSNPPQNRLSAELIGGLGEAVGKVREDRSVRAVLLRAEGENFGSMLRRPRWRRESPR